MSSSPVVGPNKLDKSFVTHSTSDVSSTSTASPSTSTSYSTRVKARIAPSSSDHDDDDDDIELFDDDDNYPGQEPASKDDQLVSTDPTTPIAQPQPQVPVPVPAPAPAARALTPAPSYIPLSSTQSTGSLLDSTGTGPTKSPNKGCTAADIEGRRLAALQRRAEVAAAREYEERMKQRQEQEAKNRRLAEESLSAYGFKLGGAVSHYATEQAGRPDLNGFDEPDGPWRASPLCSSEQLAVLERVQQGDNVFFTGSAGVGKSFLLKEITRLLKSQRKDFKVTATTGIAALNISGSTVHSWASVGLGADEILKHYGKIVNHKEWRLKWVSTQVLIIDEVSMINPILFTKLDLIGKLIRENNKPFGGIQLIVSGDFFQLPPIAPNPERTKCMRCGEIKLEVIKLERSRLPSREIPRDAQEPSVFRCSDRSPAAGGAKGCGFEWRNVTFVFESDAWAECDFLVLELTKVFRQSDEKYIAVLEKFRRGLCDQECVDMLAGCGKGLDKVEAIKPTNLYPRREQVDGENKREFIQLKEHKYVFHAVDGSDGPRGEMFLKNNGLKDIQGHFELALKKGAQVMLLANIDVQGGLVNGSRGVIVDWVSAKDLAQALEEERLRMGPQPASVRTGRMQTEEDSKIGVGSEDWRQQRMNEFLDKQKDVMLPRVMFAVGTTLTVRPHSWTIQVDKETFIWRTQLPLTLAWALTIHKSQGQSLDAVKVKLTSTFEKGQAYVALSRCRTPEGMRVEGFSPAVVMAHRNVIEFYKRLKQGKPFSSTIVPPLNPLDYLPTESVLRTRMSRVFNNQSSRPLPVGSAVLAPGQGRPPSPPPPPDQEHQSPKPQVKVKSESPATLDMVNQNGDSDDMIVDGNDWKVLLQQAARAYTDQHIHQPDRILTVIGSNERSINRYEFLNLAQAVVDEQLAFDRSRRIVDIGPAVMELEASGPVPGSDSEMDSELEAYFASASSPPPPKRRRGTRVGH